MDPDDIRAFARRDWASIEALKDEYWIERKHSMTLAELVDLGDQLRAHARASARDWPSAAERSEDIATHRRVSEALRSVRRDSTS